MPTPPLVRQHRVPVILLAAIAVSWTAACPQGAVGLTIDDLLHDPSMLEAAPSAPAPTRRDNAVAPLIFLADDRLKQGAWQDAARLAQEVLQRDPENAKAHAILGLIAALAGQSSQAEEQSAVLQTTKDTGLYAELLAAVRSGQQNNHDAAAAHLARALSQEPDHPVALYCSGYLALIRGKTAEAGQAFTAVLRHVPTFAAAHAGLGEVYRLGNQPEKAVAAYHQAIAADPENLTYRRQLIATLKATGQYENTLIIYTADQGFGMGQHGFRTKLGPYDATYRSPLIIAMPGRVAQGAVCAQPVNATDLVATTLSFMQVQVPWKLHGRDLTPLLKNPQSTPAWPCFYEHMDELYGSDARAALASQSTKGRNKVPRYTALVYEGWKLIRYHDGLSGEELYDLNTDPEELTNLIHRQEAQPRLTALRQRLQEEAAAAEL